MRVGVFGAGGRMGSTVCAAVLADPDLELVAAVDPYHGGTDLRQVTGLDGSGLLISAGPEALVHTDVEVCVDFTQAEAARQNARWCAENGVHAVIGTTGLGDDDYDDLREMFTASNCLVAPNFAIGAVLLMKFAELAAPWFESGEIVELHHDGKVDAPSGTSIRTAERMAAASLGWSDDPTRFTTIEGTRGGVGPGGIRIHSVRLHGMVAHHEVLLGTAGQSLTLRHDSYDRSSFMPGVLMACKKIAGCPGVTVGLDRLLGL